MIAVVASSLVVIASCGKGTIQPTEQREATHPIRCSNISFWIICELSARNRVMKSGRLFVLLVMVFGAHVARAEEPQFVRAVGRDRRIQAGEWVAGPAVPRCVEPKGHRESDRLRRIATRRLRRGWHAHLLEHMVFKGTPTHKDIPAMLQERGADFNGTTWLDRTN